MANRPRVKTTASHCPIFWYRVVLATRSVSPFCRQGWVPLVYLHPVVYVSLLALRLEARSSVSAGSSCGFFCLASPRLRAGMPDTCTPAHTHRRHPEQLTQRRDDRVDWYFVLYLPLRRHQIFRFVKLFPLALGPRLNACNICHDFIPAAAPPRSAPPRSAPPQHPRAVQERGLRARGQQRGLPAGPLPGGEGPPQGPPLRHVAADGVHRRPRRQGPPPGAALQPLLPR